MSEYITSVKLENKYLLSGCNEPFDVFCYHEGMKTVAKDIKEIISKGQTVEMTMIKINEYLNWFNADEG